MIRIKSVFKSISYAISGFRRAFNEEQNMRIHVFAGMFVILLAFFFEVRKWEAVTLILMITAIIILELINTIFERFSDMLQPRVHTYVKVIKDMMAATVLVAAISAIVIGILIFYPYLSEILK